ncbi:MAG: hypothetical protein IPL23_30525 [Saprospiraceae bacterium]|nr:hypothetical protein [Saprospiraceae bacterium]
MMRTSVDFLPILVDLSLIKSVSELRPSANDSVTYTIIVSNATGRILLVTFQVLIFFQME